jgi:hypothetical protein
VGDDMSNEGETSQPRKYDWDQSLAFNETRSCEICQESLVIGL